MGVKISKNLNQSDLLEYDKNINEDTKEIIKINRRLGKVKSPFRFPGSKAQAIKFIRPFWEAVDHDEYREESLL